MTKKKEKPADELMWENLRKEYKEASKREEEKKQLKKIIKRHSKFFDDLNEHFGF